MDLNRAEWRKSSRSGDNGGNCVEVATVWRKSSRSGDNGGDCVEVARNLSGAVAVRDSKNPHGPVLIMGLAGWQDFIAEVKAGRHDLAALG
jgi:Domain of unknown function (DUF397)